MSYGTQTWFTEQVRPVPEQTSHMTPPMPQFALLLPITQFPASEQHPAHIAGLQTHWPPMQCFIWPHCALVPHRHAPFAEQLSERIESQGGFRQVLPALPQLAGKDHVMHAPLEEQQPPGQDAALQMHAPPTQRLPMGQAGKLPQRQAPVTTSQESATNAAQAAQAAPAVPQVVIAGAVHTPLAAQQPFGHEAALQEQVPATQLVPATHAGLVPQRQPPASAQLSARAASHVTQAAPPPPQAAKEPVVHVDPEQQPEQFVGLQLLQTPPPQGPVPQSWHMAPPLPHEAAAVPGKQVVPEQHPVGHDVASQTHAPVKQRWPLAQAAAVPH